MYEERIGKDDVAKLGRYVVEECMVNAFNKDEDLTQFALSTQLQWEDLLRYDEMQRFVQSFIRGNEYCFPQEV